MGTCELFTDAVTPGGVRNEDAMPNGKRLITVAQFSALTSITPRDLRKILKGAPVGISFMVDKTRMVDHQELLKWMKSLPKPR